MLRTVRAGLGFAILAASILFLVWGFWPVQRELRVRSLTFRTQLALPEKRNLSLLFPPKIRAGDVGIVRLIMGIDGLSSTTPAAGNAENNGTSGDGGSSNLYATHYVIVETRFDLPGMDIRPSDLISAPISQGQTPVFNWTLRPHEAETYKGTIWLYLRTVDKVTGEERRETVSAQSVEIESVKLLGLPTNPARLIGIVGTVIGLALSLPFFIAWMKILLKNRQNL